MKKTAFSLNELLITMAIIIVIVSCVLVPTIKNAMPDADKERAKNAFAQINTIIEKMYYSSSYGNGAGLNCNTDPKSEFKKYVNIIEKDNSGRFLTDSQILYDNIICTTSPFKITVTFYTKTDLTNIDDKDKYTVEIGENAKLEIPEPAVDCADKDTYKAYAQCKFNDYFMQ